MASDWTRIDTLNDIQLLSSSVSLEEMTCVSSKNNNSVKCILLANSNQCFNCSYSEISNHWKIASVFPNTHSKKHLPSYHKKFHKILMFPYKFLLFREKSFTLSFSFKSWENNMFNQLSKGKRTVHLIRNIYDSYGNKLSI